MARPDRRIDHLVVAVHDLDAAAAFYARLGFQTGARNRHPWGTENRIIQFGSSFIELISVGADPSAIPEHQHGRFSFGGFVRDYLARREGLAMLVLDSDDAKADAAHFREREVGAFEPFFFERKGRRADGSETHVAFTLAFASSPSFPDAGFFVCQQHFPENFWNKDFQVHANGASDIRSVTLAADDPSGETHFLSTFTGAEPLALGQGGIRFPLARAAVLDVLPKGGKSGFFAFTVAIPDIAAQKQRLGDEGIPFSDHDHGLTVPAEQAFGVEIRFSAP